MPFFEISKHKNSKGLYVLSDVKKVCSIKDAEIKPQDITGS